MRDCGSTTPSDLAFPVVWLLTAQLTGSKMQTTVALIKRLLRQCGAHFALIPQELVAFFWKGPKSNGLEGSADHTVSVTAAQLCHQDVKAPTENKDVDEGSCVPVQLLLTARGS